MTQTSLYPLILSWNINLLGSFKGLIKFKCYFLGSVKTSMYFWVQKQYKKGQNLQTIFSLQMPAAFVSNVSPFSACGSWLAFTMGTVLIETCIRWKLSVQNTICQVQRFVWGTTEWEMREHRQSCAFAVACLNPPKISWWLDGERHRFLMWWFCCIYNTEDVNLKKVLIWEFLTSVSVWGMIPPPPTQKCNLSFRYIFNVDLPWYYCQANCCLNLIFCIGIKLFMSVLVPRRRTQELKMKM